MNRDHGKLLVEWEEGILCSNHFENECFQISVIRQTRQSTCIRHSEVIGFTMCPVFTFYCRYKFPKLRAVDLYIAEHLQRLDDNMFSTNTRSTGSCLYRITPDPQAASWKIAIIGPIGITCFSLISFLCCSV